MTAAAHEPPMNQPIRLAPSHAHRRSQSGARLPRSAVARHRRGKPGSAGACPRLAKPACWRVSVMAHAAVAPAPHGQLRATAGKPAPPRRWQATALLCTGTSWTAPRHGGQARPAPAVASHRTPRTGTSWTAPRHGGQARRAPAVASHRTPLRSQSAAMHPMMPCDSYYCAPAKPKNPCNPWFHGRSLTPVRAVFRPCG